MLLRLQNKQKSLLHYLPDLNLTLLMWLTIKLYKIFVISLKNIMLRVKILGLYILRRSSDGLSWHQVGKKNIISLWEIAKIKKSMLWWWVVQKSTFCLENQLQCWKVTFLLFIKSWGIKGLRPLCLKKCSGDKEKMDWTRHIWLHLVHSQRHFRRVIIIINISIAKN